MPAPRIGLACPNPGERAAFIEWCTANNYQPAPMLDADSIQRELAGQGFEALVIDADLAGSRDTPAVLRTLGRNRPVIVIGNDDGAAAALGRRDATVLTRPVPREMFLFALTMALAEGRPARRSPRRLVARLHAVVEGHPARLIDVSAEGIRLEMAEQYRSTLPPVISIAVPTFNVTVVGRRVWVNNSLEGSRRAFWAGVRLERNSERQFAAWYRLVEHAPASTALTTEAVNYL
jgi:hypothetical protein